MDDFIKSLTKEPFSSVNPLKITATGESIGNKYILINTLEIYIRRIDITGKPKDR